MNRLPCSMARPAALALLTALAALAACGPAPGGPERPRRTGAPAAGAVAAPPKASPAGEASATPTPRSVATPAAGAGPPAGPSGSPAASPDGAGAPSASPTPRPAGTPAPAATPAASPTPTPLPSAAASAAAGAGGDFAGGRLALTMTEVAGTQPDLTGLPLAGDNVSASRTDALTNFFFGFPFTAGAATAASFGIRLTGAAPAAGQAYVVGAGAALTFEVLAGGKTWHWKATSGTVTVTAATGTVIVLNLDAAFGPDPDLEPGAGTFRLRGEARADDVAAL